LPLCYTAASPPVVSKTAIVDMQPSLTAISSKVVVWSSWRGGKKSQPLYSTS
jgi:hypothetical protein